MTDPWARVCCNEEDRERIARKPRSFTKDVTVRFAHKPTALFGLVVIILLIGFAVFGPLLTPYTFDSQTLGMANIPPILDLFQSPEPGRFLYMTANMKLIETDGDGHLIRTLTRLSDDFLSMRETIEWDTETRIYLDYASTPPRVLDQNEQSLPHTLRLWNRTYLLGTDHLGRDILTRLMYGTRISLIIAFVAATVNMFIGTLYGGISGYMGGRVDSVMMRLVDVISTIPLTLYVILIKVMLTSGLSGIIIALSSVYWVDMARVVRGQALSLKQQEFILAARSIGSSPRSILVRHVIPNAMGPILVTMMMLIPSAIFMEAFMSYIGIGIAPPMASLGTMCNDAAQALRSNPYQLFMPALIICLIMFAFNFTGDGLRDALDPKLRK